MNAEENRKILEEAIAKWKAGDGMAIFNLLADDVVWTVIGSTAVSGTYRSRQAFIDGAVTAIGARIDGMVAPEIVDILAVDDTIVLRWDGKGCMRDGAPYENRYSWTMRFQNGKVVEGTAYLDTALVDRLMALPDEN